MIVGFDLEKAIKDCTGHDPYTDYWEYLKTIEYYEFTRMDTWHKGIVQIWPYAKLACYSRTGKWEFGVIQQISIDDAKKLLYKGKWFNTTRREPSECMYISIQKPKKLGLFSKCKNFIAYLLEKIGI